MRKLFKNIKGYATPANAEKKLKSVIEKLHESDSDKDKNPRYLIAVTEEGRFVPVVVAPDDMAFFAHNGVAVCA